MISITKEPKGTLHTDYQYHEGKPFEVTYRVHRVVEPPRHIPGVTEPHVYLVAQGRYGYAHQKHVNYPLPDFIDIFKPKTENDVFWRGTKQHQPEAVSEGEAEIVE